MFLIQAKPYKHFVKYDFLSAAQFELLREMVPLLKWEMYERDSYRYFVSGLDFECAFYQRTRNVLDSLISSTFIASISKSFDVPLTRCVDASFHRMEVGHFSAPHTDANINGEIVRIVHYFSDLESYRGGELVLYINDSELREYYVHRLPENSAFGFLMGGDSFHAATEIVEGNRLCLVLTYG
jgi:hypothetical protein